MQFVWLLFLFSTVLCDHDEDTWVEPNAWTREKHDLSLYDEAGSGTVTVSAPRVKEQCAKCAAGNSDDAVAQVYYRKFIANLFSRQKLQYDEETELYQRALLFTLQPQQLERLEQLNDPRDLDSILTEIFAKARAPSTHTAFGEKSGWSTFALVWDILKDLAQLLKASEVQFMLVVALAVLIGWFLHRRYGIGIVTIIVGGVLLFGYFITYLECNKKLEVEQMLDVLKRQQQAVPENTPPRWYTSIFSWFGSRDAEKEANKKLIREAGRLNLAFCRPDHVFMIYVNELLLKQLEFLIEKCTATFISVKENLPFPFNIIAPVALLCMIAYILKLTFKYILSPRAWAALLHRPAASNHQHHAQLPTGTSGVAALNEDRISGENLRLLLDAIKAPKLVVHNSSASMSTLPLASGVQEVLDKLEAAPTEDGNSSTANSLQSSNNESQTHAKTCNNNNKSNKNAETVDESTAQLEGDEPSSIAI